MSAIPCHVAFIMDGNGRWAVKRGLSRLKGHREGIKKAELVIDYCLRRGIEVVSLFVFSTENWKRAEREVAGLFKLASRYLDNIADFSKRGIRVVVSGDLSRLPEELVLKINKAETATVSNRVMTLNLCINYGGRAELTHAVNEIIRSGKNSVSEKELGEFICHIFDQPVEQAYRRSRVYLPKRVNDRLARAVDGETLTMKNLMTRMAEKIKKKVIR